MADKDLSMYLNHTALHPKILEKGVIKVMNDDLVAESLLSVRPWSGRAVFWKVKTTDEDKELSDVRPVGEGSTVESLGADYEEKTASAKEYRFHWDITEQDMKWVDTVEPVSEAVQSLGAKLRLVVENDVINTLQDTTTYPGIASTAVAVTWDTIATATPYKDIMTQNKEYKRKNAGLKPDAIIMTGDDSHNLMLTDDVRDRLKYIQDTVTDFGLGRIAGLAIAEANAVKTGAVTPSDYEYLFSGTAIVMKRGITTGKIYDAEKVTVRRYVNNDTRSIRIQTFRTFKTVITRPKQIRLLTGLT